MTTASAISRALNRTGITGHTVHQSGDAVIVTVAGSPGDIDATVQRVESRLGAYTVHVARGLQDAIMSVSRPDENWRPTAPALYPRGTIYPVSIRRIGGAR